MEKTVLIELTAKKIKLAELIVLMCLFGSIAAGLGLMYLWLPPARNYDVLYRRNCLPRVLLRPRMAMVDERVKRRSAMCEHCIDCFFRDEDGDREQCIFDLENPIEINYSDPACEHFELSETAVAERRKQPGEL